MKVLHINYNDIKGGAARAAYRLHTGLLNKNINSKMLVQKKDSDDTTVIGPETKLGKGWSLVKPEIDKLPLKIFNHNQSGPWSVNWFPTNVTKKIEEINPDIVNL
ncbi:MAG: glycosyl transferase, partial [Candidatus Brocadiia bacterium]